MLLDTENWNLVDDKINEYRSSKRHIILAECPVHLSNSKDSLFSYVKLLEHFAKNLRYFLFVTWRPWDLFAMPSCCNGIKQIYVALLTVLAQLEIYQFAEIRFYTPLLLAWLNSCAVDRMIIEIPCPPILWQLGTGFLFSVVQFAVRWSWKLANVAAAVVQCFFFFFFAFGSFCWMKLLIKLVFYSQFKLLFEIVKSTQTVTSM